MKLGTPNGSGPKVLLLSFGCGVLDRMKGMAWPFVRKRARQLTGMAMLRCMCMPACHGSRLAAGYPVTSSPTGTVDALGNISG